MSNDLGIVTRFGPHPERRFYQLDENLLHAPLDPTSKLLLVDLFHYENRGVYVRGLNELAGHLAVSVSTIHRAIRCLIADGYLIVAERPGKATLYLAAFPPIPTDHPDRPAFEKALQALLGNVDDPFQIDGANAINPRQFDMTTPVNLKGVHMRANDQPDLIHHNTVRATVDDPPSLTSAQIRSLRDYYGRGPSSREVLFAATLLKDHPHLTDAHFGQACQQGRATCYAVMHALPTTPKFLRDALANVAATAEPAVTPTVKVDILSPEAEERARVAFEADRARREARTRAQQAEDASLAASLPPVDERLRLGRERLASLRGSVAEPRSAL